jgi:hypothetical protein
VLPETVQAFESIIVLWATLGSLVVGVAYLQTYKNSSRNRVTRFIQREVECHVGRWWPLPLKLHVLFMAIVFLSISALGLFVLIKDILRGGP